MYSVHNARPPPVLIQSTPLGHSILIPPRYRVQKAVVIVAHSALQQKEFLLNYRGQSSLKFQLNHKIFDHVIPKISFVSSEQAKTVLRKFGKTVAKYPRRSPPPPASMSGLACPYTTMCPGNLTLIQLCVRADYPYTTMNPHS